MNPAEQKQRSALSHLTNYLCNLLMYSAKPQQLSTPQRQQQQQQSSTMAAGGSSTADRIQPASSSGSGTAAAGCEQVLQPHLVQILKRMEGFVRVTAGAPAWLQQGDQECFVAVAALGSTLNKCHSGFVPLVCKAGFGSVELLQLYSLLSSLVKACAVFRSVNTPATTNVLFSAANAAGEALTCYSSTGIAAASSSSKSKTRQASIKAASAAAADAASMLPSLVIMGRCCLLWAQGMQQMPPASAARELFGQRLMACALGQLVLGHDLKVPMITGPEACRDWLQRHDVAAQLSASGYDPQVLRQQVTEYLEAFQDVEHTGADDAETVGAAVTAMLLKMQDLGLAFAVLAIPEACNNRSCHNLCGLKEKSLVSGKGCLCSGCRVAHYCCKDCQTQHWKQHKPVCRALKAAKGTVSK